MILKVAFMDATLALYCEDLSGIPVLQNKAVPGHDRIALVACRRDDDPIARIARRLAGKETGIDENRGRHVRRLKEFNRHQPIKPDFWGIRRRKAPLGGKKPHLPRRNRRYEHGLRDIPS